MSVEVRREPFPASLVAQLTALKDGDVFSL
jgi:hypothetical protein